MVRVKLSDDALDDLGKIDQIIARRIVAKMLWLEENFANMVPERLHYDLRDLYKLRVGDYRVVYLVRGDLIVVEAIEHRREIYK